MISGVLSPATRFASTQESKALLVGDGYSSETFSMKPMLFARRTLHALMVLWCTKYGYFYVLMIVH